MHGDITIYRPDHTGTLMRVGVVTLKDAWERTQAAHLGYFARRSVDARAPRLLPPEQRVSPYKFVYYMTNYPWLPMKRWAARPLCPVLGRYVWCGLHTSVDDAAGAAARYLDCTVEDLRK